MTPNSTLNSELVVEKLKPLNNVYAKKMFGGYGIFSDEEMFGIIDPKGKLYFKTNDQNENLFQDINSEKHNKMPYHSIPDDILNDQETLISLAESSIKISGKK